MPGRFGSKCRGGVEYARLREEIERIREEQRRIMDRLDRMEAKG